MAGRYKAYSEYKDSGVEWLGEVPEHWKVAAISSCSTKITNGYVGPTRDIFFETGVRYLQSLHIKRNQINFHTPYYVSEKWSKEKSKSILKEGDVLVVQTGDIGQVAAVTKEFEGCNCHALIIISTNDKLDGFYLSWLLNSTYGFDSLKSIQTGALHPHLNCDLVKTIKSLIPTLKEQQKIASFLDHETAKIDTLIAKQEKLIELLKEKRQAVISHAVTKGLNPDAPMKDSGVEWLGEVPEGWKIIPLKHIMELTPKKSHFSGSKDDFCSFIPMEKLKRDTLVLDEQKQIQEVFDGYTYFQDEDVLIAKVTPCFENKNMTVARNLTNGIGFGSSEIYVLRCNQHVINDFLCYRLQEEQFMNIATSAMTGAGGLKRVPSDFILNFQIALPNAIEQQEIIRSLSRKTATIDILEKKALAAIELMKERRTALISAAVTGKIDVRDWQPPEQEVALET